MTSNSSWILGLFYGALTAAASAQQAAPLPYVEPSFAAPLFDRSAFAIDSATEAQFHDVLLRVARLPEIDGPTRGKVMALAYTLFPKDREIIVTDFKIRFPGRFNEPPEADPEARIMLRSRLSKAVVALTSSAPVDLNDQNRPRASRFISDVLRNLQSPEERAISEKILAETGRQPIPPPDWSVAFPNGISETFTPRTFTPSQDQIYSTKISTTLQSFPKRQSLIKGLLVVQLQGAQFAGEASQMNATAMNAAAGEPTLVSFNQDVGPDMTKALDRVLRFLDQKHGGFPAGHRIEISFEDHYTGKDGPSAAVACSLLLNSLLSGNELDSGFAVTGDLNADGKVRPVGGIEGKIRGASHRHSTHVAVPYVSRSQLSDLLITDGIAPFTKIQVFTIRTFYEAFALAAAPDARDPKIKESIETFTSLQQILNQPNGERMLSNPQVRERLSKVVELTPNHASARLLLLKAANQEPKSFSIGGSLAAIDQAALPLIQALKAGKLGQRTSLETDQITEAIFGLRRIRSKLDSRAWPIVDAMSDFSDLLRTLRTNPPGSPDRYNALVDKINNSGQRIDEGYNRLANDPKIKQEMEEE